MAPWDDAEVDSDGDELLDWLWDLPDRYDVGFDDDGPGVAAPGAAVAADGAGVRKHVRRPGDFGEEPPTPPRGWRGWGPGDRPTVAIDSADRVADRFVAPPLITGMVVQPRPSRFNARDLAAAAAVVLVVAGGIGLGYSLLKGKSNSSHLSVGNPATTQPTSFDQNVIPPVSVPLPAETTTTATTVPTTTTVTVPAVVPAKGSTTTTTRRATTTSKSTTTTTKATTTTSSTSTSTTTPGSTTSSTSSTIPSSTTSSSVTTSTT